MMQHVTEQFCDTLAVFLFLVSELDTLSYTDFDICPKCSFLCTVPVIKKGYV